MRLGAFALPVLLHAAACGSEPTAAAATSEGDAGSNAECGGRAEPFFIGLTSSSQSLTFEILELTPAEPVLSQSAPGNTWTVRIVDAAGQPVSDAALVVHTFMPDHNHTGPSAVGVEETPGTYLIENLLLPMPALYTVTLRAALAAGGSEDIGYSICIRAQTG